MIPGCFPAKHGVRLVMRDFDSRRNTPEAIEEAWETLVAREFLAHDQAPDGDPRRYFASEYRHNPPSVGSDILHSPSELSMLELWAALGKQKIAWAEAMSREIARKFRSTAEEIVWDVTVTTHLYPTLYTRKKDYDQRSGLSRKESPDYWQLMDAGLYLCRLDDRINVCIAKDNFRE